MHEFKFKGPLTCFAEGMVLGNGDMGCVFTATSDCLIFELGKNDVWDSRWNTHFEHDPKKVVLKHDDLIKLSQKYGFNWGKNDEKPVSDQPLPPDIPVLYATPAYYADKARYTSPCPKRVVEIRVQHPGLSTTQIKGTLNVHTGILEVSIQYNPNTILQLRAFIHPKDNVLFLKITPQRTVPWLRIDVIKYPDAVDPLLPMPKLELISRSHIRITQSIPGGEGTDPFHWCIAAEFPGKVLPFSYQGRFEVEPFNKPLCLTVAIAVSREAPDPEMRSVQLLQKYERRKFEDTADECKDWWDSFWAKSSISLEDKYLENAWYKDLYVIACNMRKGVNPPGLFGNMTQWDAAIWHSDYHWDMNVQKPYWPLLPVNHPELSEVYGELIKQMMPTFCFLADLIFGLPGAYVEIATFPYLSPEKTYINNKYGRFLGMTGWVARHLWRHWEFTGDEEFLQNIAYPFLKQAADFYHHYLEKYQDEDGDIFPSIPVEWAGWKKNFSTNRNFLVDLLYFKQIFRWASAATEILEVDKEYRQVWKVDIKKIPLFKIIKHKGISLIEPYKGFVDEISTDEEEISIEWIFSNTWLIFPGEELSGDGKDEITETLREVLNQTKEFKDEIHWGFWTVVPALRLKMPGAYERVRDLVLNNRHVTGLACLGRVNETGVLPYNWGIQVEDFWGAFAITEFLIQSQGDIIRLFPCLPAGQNASFKNLRARGGFLISAEWAEKSLKKLTVISIIGGICRLSWPGGCKELNTKADQIYQVV